MPHEQRKTKRNMFTLINVLLLLLSIPILLILHKYFLSPSKPNVMVLDFACFKPPPTKKWSKDFTLRRTRETGAFSTETMEFMKRVMEMSGIGDSTFLPDGFRQDPMDVGLEEARKESEMVMFNAVDEVLAKTGVKGVEIGIVIVNCCIFNAVPSFSDVIVNRYKLGDEILCYDLSGMGCTASLTAIALAKQLLKIRPNSYALLISTENITQNMYKGNDRSMLLVNCLFRIGGAAVLLSNRPFDRRTAKYRLLHTVHTNTASSDLAYNCIYRKEDTTGRTGISINRDLLTAAVNAIKVNITTVGRLVLPLSEKIRYLVINHMCNATDVKTHVPNFKTAIDHIVTHVGGKPVLDDVERSLKLSKMDMEASRMTLYRFGNVSSSSVWYGLAYVEAKRRVKRKDRVWQIAFGSGFKCASVILEAISSIDREEENPWTHEIDEFPVDQEGNMITNFFPYYFKSSE